LISGDRRDGQRYALTLPVRFSFPRRGVAVEGAGVTIDLSRRGILFNSEVPPPDRQPMELRIAWPYRLQGVCALELVAHGFVVRTDSRGTLFEVRDYAFRTCGEQSFQQEPQVGANCNVVG
jgi:hypothetical protein